MTDQEPTTTGDATMADEPSSSVGIKIRGEQLVLRPGMLGVAPSSALRTQSHGAWTVPELFASVARGIGPEELAGMVFLARRQARQNAAYAAVCSEIDALSESGATVGVVHPGASEADVALARAAAVVIDFTWSDDSPEA